MQYTGLVGTVGVVVRRFQAEQASKGFLAACGLILSLVWKVLLTPVYAFTRGRRTFTLDGRQYRYLCHWYNTTFENERAVEIPLALGFLEGTPDANVLEIGNVLTHYSDRKHDVLDKYEAGPGVINQDLIDFAPEKKYDRIVSISTIEHVGFDEIPVDPGKILVAEQAIRRLLSPGGKALVTIPVAYNPNADALLKSGKLFPDQRYLKRISRSNEWAEVTKEEAFACRYNDPWMFGNALVLCTITA